MNKVEITPSRKIKILKDLIKHVTNKKTRPLDIFTCVRVDVWSQEGKVTPLEVDWYRKEVKDFPKNFKKDSRLVWKKLEKRDYKSTLKEFRSNFDSAPFNTKDINARVVMLNILITHYKNLKNEKAKV